MRRAPLPPATLREILAANKKAVDDYLFRFLPAVHPLPEITLLYQMMREYPSRPGKGLRPSLCLLTCEALGGKRESALNTAAALELFQDWILIHDDIEDDSDLRRGQPVLHKRYGVPLSINAGDALHGKMWEVLLRNRELVGDDTTLKVLGEVTHMVNETTEGQHMELRWVQQNRWDLSDNDYFAMCEKKTSWYTCIAPCRLGALLATRNGQLLNALVPFGRDLGIAFQIRDDLLNLIGDEGKYGKETAGDLWEGKRTLILIRLLATCPDPEKGELLQIMSKPRSEKASSEVTRVFEAMKKYHALEQARKIAELYALRAKKQFDEIFQAVPDTAPKTVLRDLITYMVTREW